MCTTPGAVCSGYHKAFGGLFVISCCVAQYRFPLKGNRFCILALAHIVMLLDLGGIVHRFTRKMIFTLVFGATSKGGGDTAKRVDSALVSV